MAVNEVERNILHIRQKVNRLHWRGRTCRIGSIGRKPPVYWLQMLQYIQVIYININHISNYSIYNCIKYISLYTFLYISKIVL